MPTGLKKREREIKINTVTQMCTPSFQKPEAGICVCSREVKATWQTLVSKQVGYQEGRK